MSASSDAPAARRALKLCVLACQSEESTLRILAAEEVQPKFVALVDCATCLSGDCVTRLRSHVWGMRIEGVRKHCVTAAACRGCWELSCS